jgi:Ca2+-binding EF-hand superfamily protein
MKIPSILPAAALCLAACTAHAQAQDTPATKESAKPDRPPLRVLLKQADADKDGKVTYSEILKVAPDFPRKAFDRHDTNKDGALTMSELPERPAGAGKGGGSGRDRIREADTNKDGKVTPEEFKVAFPNAESGRFEKLDHNKDGVLTESDAEARAAEKKTKEKAESKPAPTPESKTEEKKDTPTGESAAAAPPRTGFLEQLIKDADADKDGKVSQEELAKAKPGMPDEAFKRMDTNADGYITSEDRPSGPQRGEYAQRMREADKDGDAKVSFAEAQAAFPGITREKFDERDRNKDGVLSRDDYQRPQNP